MGIDFAFNDTTLEPSPVWTSIDEEVGQRF